MIKKIILLLCLLSAPALRAITAGEVLNKVLSAVESAPSLTLALKAVSENGSGSGSLTVARECFTFSGEDIKVFYDGKTQWTYQPSEKEVSVTTPTANELAEVNPLAFLRNYQVNYKVSMLSSTKTAYKIKMVSNRRSLYIRSAVVTINSSTWLPTEVTAELSNGGKLTVTVLSAVKGKKQTSDYFRFSTSANPGVEVIDLR